MTSKTTPAPAGGREQETWQGPPSVEERRPTASERGLHGEHQVGGATGADERQPSRDRGGQPLRSGPEAGKTLTRGTGQAGQERNAALGGTHSGTTADAATGGAGNPDLHREQKKEKP